MALLGLGRDGYLSDVFDEADAATSNVSNLTSRERRTDDHIMD